MSQPPGSPAGSGDAGGAGAGRRRHAQAAPAAKTTVAELGVEPDALAWTRSGHGAGAIEIAFVAAAGRVPAAAADCSGIWVLMRVAGDPASRVLVYDRHEWECFLDGVRNGEFDDAAGPPSS